MKKEEAKMESKLNWIDDQFAVANVKNHSDSCTFFNLYVKSSIGNIAIYGCKVVTTEDYNDFIAFPTQAYNAKDGSKKYSNHCSIIFNDGIAQKIIDEVAKMI